MATAKKASKKPVKKTTAKKASAKKSASKTASAKASAKKATTSKTLSPVSLFKLHVVSAVASAGLAVLSALLLVPTTTQFILSYMTRDGLASADKVALAPAARVIWEVEISYLLAGIFAISALGSLLLATSLKKRYNSTVANQTSGFRWLFVGISAALLLEFASLLVGIHDVATLKLIGALVLVTSLLSWFSERENKGSATPKWLAYTVALVTGALAWIPLLISMIGTPLYGMERFSWYVYAFAGILLLGFMCFARIQYKQILGVNKWKNYLYAERNYLVVDLAMKIAAGAVIIAALQN